MKQNGSKKTERASRNAKKQDTTYIPKAGPKSQSVTLKVHVKKEHASFEDDWDQEQRVLVIDQPEKWLSSADQEYVASLFKD